MLNKVKHPYRFIQSRSTKRQRCFGKQPPAEQDGPETFLLKSKHALTTSPRCAAQLNYLSSSEP